MDPAGWAWGLATAGGGPGRDAASATDGIVRLAVVAAAVVAVGIAMRRGRQRRAREARENAAAPKPSDARQARTHRREADKALLEMVELGRELCADVTTRIHVLNELVKEADERIRVLAALNKNAAAAIAPPALSPAPPPPGPGAVDAPPEAAAVAVPAAAGCGGKRGMDKNGDNRDNKDDEGAPSPPLSPPRPERRRRRAVTEAEAARRALHRRIYHMHRDGQTPGAIATTLALSLTEVNLAIALAEPEEAGNEMHNA